MRAFDMTKIDKRLSDEATGAFILNSIRKGGDGSMSVYRHIRASGVRNLVKDNDKRCGADFLDGLDRFVEKVVRRACGVFNGHKKTLDRTVLNHVTENTRKE